MSLVVGLEVLAAPLPAHATPVPDSQEGRVTAESWFTPAVAGGSPAFDRPTWQVGLTSWRGPWGLGAGATIFGGTSAPFQADPFLPAGGWMGDLNAAYRWSDQGLTLRGGARWLSFRLVGFASLGVDYQRALAGDWLWGVGSLTGGTNINRAYVLDGALRLLLRKGAWTASAGYRMLSLQCGCNPPEPPVSIAGPTAELGLSF